MSAREAEIAVDGSLAGPAAGPLARERDPAAPWPETYARAVAAERAAGGPARAS